MTVNDLLLRALNREPLPRRPLWIMRQAGRYLPEYRALREKNRFEDLCAQPDLATEVTMMPFARFPLDGAIVFADIMSPIASLGLNFHFDPGPIMESPVRTQEEIDNLRDPGPEEIAPEVMTTLRQVSGELNGRATLLGFAGAPWTLAAYLVEGSGKRNFPTFRAWAHTHPERLDALLEKLTSLVICYLGEQKKAGAQAVQIFDSWVGILSVADWERWVRPHLERLMNGIADTGLKRILFLQNAPHLVPSYAELPSDCLAIDWRMDLQQVQKSVAPHGKAVQGNLDPAVLLAGAAVTKEKARELLARTDSHGHVMNLGHGIFPNTPIESVEALIEAVHEEAPSS